MIEELFYNQWLFPIPRRTLEFEATTSVFDPMLSKKSFWGNRLNFLKPLMRFVRRDVRDHIVS